MCHADMTLETPLYVTNETFGGPTGWGITHQCRDWDTVHGFIEKHMVVFDGAGEPVLWGGEWSR